MKLNQVNIVGGWHEPLNYEELSDSEITFVPKLGNSNDNKAPLDTALSSSHKTKPKRTARVSDLRS